VARNDNEVIRTRATLLGRMKDLNDQVSWQQFFDIYWRLIYGMARKAGLGDAEAQDVVQETMAAVAKQMPGFVYNPSVGTFKAWLLTQTRWRIVDQFRKRGPIMAHPPEASTSARTDVIERIPDEKSLDWDAIWQADWEKSLLEAAMSRVQQHLDPQKFQIFDLYVNREWPPEKVAQTFKVTVNQVYLVKNRVTELLREEFRRLEQTVT
jgi:RNA polymerase sigma-70 factor (ECF subfamily)